MLTFYYLCFRALTNKTNKINTTNTNIPYYFVSWRELKDICKEADILIVAIGKPKYVNKDYIKTGAVVIDVGINRNSEGKLCGDADFDSCIDVVSRITPVPGGVGLMTRANLLKNTVKSAKNSAKQRKN